MAKQGVSNNKPAGGNNNNKKDPTQAWLEKQSNKGAGKQYTPGAGGYITTGSGGGSQGQWNPGEENPATQPFLTQQDIEEFAEAREQYEEGLRELDRNYEAKKHEAEYESAEIEKGRISNKDSANWDFAGRGLFRSSIRDADLADIDATAEIKKKFLSDSLNALAVYNQGQKQSMEARWNRYNEGLKRKEVENAEGVNANMPKWKVEPHWENKAPEVQKANKGQQAKAFGDLWKKNMPAVGQNSGLETSKPRNALDPAKPAGNNQQQAKSFASKSISGKLYG